MARNMRRKHDMYWGSVDNINCILLVAMVLDQRYKLKYAKYYFGCFYDPSIANELIKKVETVLHNLLEFYGDGLFWKTQVLLKRTLEMLRKICL